MSGLILLYGARSERHPWRRIFPVRVRAFCIVLC